MRTNKVGIYNSKVCENSRIEKPEDGKLRVTIDEYCAWCNLSHKFYLKEVDVLSEIKTSHKKENK